MANKKLISFFLTLGSLVTTSSYAEQATLSPDLTLDIPVIHYQTDEQSNYFWAQLKPQDITTNSIIFSLSDFGVLDPSQLPPKLLDLAQVTEGVAPRIVDISSTSARLTFISSIPLACSVVYGKTMEFGSVAVDSAMNGGAIIDHNPLLTQLEPETTYYYRVQGTDASGKMYWSPAEQFTTPIAIANNNLLSLNNGATVTAVSSNFGGGANDSSWGANNAIDDSSATAWSSASDGNQAFIEITLAQTELIDHITVWSRSMSDGSAKILSFTLTLDDNETLGVFQLPDTEQTHSFTINRNASRIRLNVEDSTGGNTGLIGIAAYNTP